MKVVAPTYYMGDELDMLNKDYYPVITSIKHSEKSKDLIEIRRAIIFRRFKNIYPLTEEVIYIDRSKLQNSKDDIVFQ